MSVDVATRRERYGPEGLMPGPEPCPFALQLEAYFRSELATDAACAVEAHLATCTPCFNALMKSVTSDRTIPQVPGYLVISELGRGRFGAVYKAWTTSGSRRLVALKLLTALGEMESSRFEREIAVLERIVSPGIVRYLENGIAAGTRYLVMEYIHGTHLNDYLASTTLSLIEKLTVLERICRAVAAAHAQGVIHRDLKPRNILVDRSGQPHILDFGICSVDAPDWTSWARQTITLPGDVIGTLKYMSPEQAWGGVAGKIGPSTDVWALGIMLHDIVTSGGYPYSLASTPDRPAPEALLDRIRKELPWLPRLERVHRGRDLAVLVERCLSYEPNLRISSAAALADDLQRYCRGERIHTRPLGLPQRLRRIAVGAATRSRWPFSVALVATTTAFVWIAAAIFDVGWYMPVAPRRAIAQASAGTAALDAPQSIIVSGVTDVTPAVVVNFAREAAMPDVTADPITWRAIHGRIMERLATAQPLCVVWDYYFRQPGKQDEVLLRGIRALEDNGTPVVLASHQYDQAGKPGLSPALSQNLGRRLRHGAIAARDMIRRPGEFVLAVVRNDDSIIPSVALTTLAAMLHPEARLDVEWLDRSSSLTLLYETQPGAYLRSRDRIELTKSFPSGLATESVRDGDVLGCVTYFLRPPEYWQAKTVDYAELLVADDQRLKVIAGGKILIFGDLRTAASVALPDRHAVDFGGRRVPDVPGVYLLADSIAGVLAGPFIRSARPLPPPMLAGVLVLAILGTLLPIRLACTRSLLEPTGRQWLWGALTVACVVSLAAFAGSRDHASVLIGMACFATALPMLGAFWVEFARNRHRMLERSRASALALDDWPTGTITLEPLRPKSP